MNIGYLNIGTLEHVFADNRRQVCEFIYKNLKQTLSEDLLVFFCLKRT